MVWQLATPGVALAARVQLAALNWFEPPELFVAQLTLPVGIVLTVAVSVTVAVHAADWSTTSVVGVQVTTVVVAAAVTLNELLGAPVTPLLVAESV